MKRRVFIQTCAAGAVTMLADKAQLVEAAPTNLEDAFRNPPVAGHPDTYWFWMNGNISKVGITRDLEDMKRLGIRGFQMFQAGTGIVKGPVDYTSPEYVEMLRHAVRESGRLGLQFGMHNCPGWSSSGGPWLNDHPELSMQVLTWTETTVAGGQSVGIALPQPNSTLNFYSDAMVLAFPAPAGAAAQPTRITSNSASVDAKLLNGDPAGGVEIRPAAEGQPAWLQLEFAQPIEARSIVLRSAVIPAPGAGRGPGGGGAGGGGRGAFAIGGLSLEASDDGVQFRKVADIAGGGGGGRGPQLPSTVNLPATRARFFRLVSTQARRISEIRLAGTGWILNWTSKAGFGGGRGGRGAAAMVPIDLPSGSFIDPNTVVDLTQSMDAQGRLNWQAPAGVWTILRIGHTTTGAENRPPPDGGGGLEVDKFSKKALDYHFDHCQLKDLLDVLAPLAAKGQAHRADP